jgi:exosortase/archaeosortase family protein
MNKQSRRLLGLFSRYIALILLGLGNLYLFYKILTPITIKSVSIILSILGKSKVIENIIVHNGTIIEIIPACVAGAAFYLLFILILSTAEIRPKKRAIALMAATLMLFVLNVLRIVFLALISSALYFELIHWIFWHLVSTIFVVAVWLVTIKIYEIKTIPIYSDIKYVKSLINPVKKTKRHKKN